MRPSPGRQDAGPVAPALPEQHRAQPPDRVLGRSPGRRGLAWRVAWRPAIRPAARWWGGSATIAGQGSADVTIDQATDRAILHWDDFSIDVGETTQFNQPGAGSIALNRVTGSAQSMLLGTLRANGNVWLVNPNGVFAGSGAVIDVNGFLGTTADILDSDFLDGDNVFRFDLPSANLDATVVNHGDITVGAHGLAALVAPGVENDGVIVGRMAQVVLGGTPTFTLDFAGDGLITFEVGSQVAQAARRADRPRQQYRP